MNAKPVNAMTVDVEDYFHVAALASAIPRERWMSMEYRVESNTARLIDFFSSSGVQATFFVLGWVAKRSPGLVRMIHGAGHEVACHGLSHELIYRQTPEEFERETREAKSVLEDLIGGPVIGYRAASWSITASSLWALDIIADLGFHYDSSIFPIVHDRYGIPNGPRRPTRIATPRGQSVVEFPPSTASLFGLRIPVAGGGYFRLLPYSVTRWGLRQINDSADPFTFYLHPWEVDPDQPRIQAGRLSTFRHYTNLKDTEPRLRRLVKEFSFTTMREVLAGVGLLPSDVALPAAVGA